MVMKYNLSQSWSTTKQGKEVPISEKRDNRQQPSPNLGISSSLLCTIGFLSVLVSLPLEHSLSYPLQCRIILSKVQRKVGIFLSWGELLMVVPFFAAIAVGALFSFVYPSVSISGHAARTPLIFLFCHCRAKLVLNVNTWDSL